MMKYLKELILGTISLMKGMLVTFKHMFHPPITVQYPEEKLVMAQRFRGRLVMPVDPTKNDHRCTACGICIKACPNHSIDVEKLVDETGKPRPKATTYSYNLATCMFCNLCVEVCPFAAIIMSDEYSTPSLKRDTMVRELVAEKYILTGTKAAWWQNKFKDGE